MTRIFGRGFYKGGILRVNYLRPVLVNKRISARVLEDIRSQDQDGVTRVIAAIWCQNELRQKIACGIATARLVDGEPAYTLDLGEGVDDTAGQQ